MLNDQPSAAEMRVLRADAARVRAQQPTADVVELPPRDEHNAQAVAS